MAFRGTFAVETTTGPRWSAALDALRNSESIVFVDVQVTLMTNGTVRSVVESAWSDRSQIDRAAAERDLDRAESAIAFLRQNSTDFRTLTENRLVDAQLVSNYGMGSVLVAQREAGATVWRDR